MTKSRNERLLADNIKELRLVHEAFKELSLKERQAVIQFDTDKVAQLSAEREVLAAKMQSLADQQKALAIELGAHEGERLSEFVARTPELADIQDDIVALKESIKDARAENTRTGAVSQFALNIVNSSFSIMRSAGDAVVTNYTPGGKITKSVHPTESRQRALKEA